MNTYNLIYLSELKSVLNVENTYTATDERLKRAIQSSTATIQNLLGRNLSKNTYTQILDTKMNYATAYDIYGESNSGAGSYAKPTPIALKHYPIDPVAAFEVRLDFNGIFGTDTILDSTSYTVDYEQGLLWIHTSTPAAKRVLQVTYTAGYASVTEAGSGDIAISPNLPDDLVQAALWQAQHIYEKGFSSNLNSMYSGAAGSTNSYRFINFAGITPEAMAVIAQYKRPKVAVF